MLFFYLKWSKMLPIYLKFSKKSSTKKFDLNISVIGNVSQIENLLKTFSFQFFPLNKSRLSPLIA